MEGVLKSDVKDIEAWNEEVERAIPLLKISIRDVKVYHFVRKSLKK